MTAINYQCMYCGRVYATKKWPDAAHLHEGDVTTGICQECYDEQNDDPVLESRDSTRDCNGIKKWCLALLGLDDFVDIKKSE